MLYLIHLHIPVFMILAYDSDVISFLKTAHAEPSFPFEESAFISLEVTTATVKNGWLEIPLVVVYPYLAAWSMSNAYNISTFRYVFTLELTVGHRRIFMGILEMLRVSRIILNLTLIENDVDYGSQTLIEVLICC